MATLGEAVLPMQVEPASKSSLQEFSAREVRYLIGWLGPFTLNPRRLTKATLQTNTNSTAESTCMPTPCTSASSMRLETNTCTRTFQVRDTKSLWPPSSHSPRIWWWLASLPSTGIGCATSAKPTKSRSSSDMLFISRPFTQEKSRMIKSTLKSSPFYFEVVTSRLPTRIRRLGVAHAICSGAALT